MAGRRQLVPILALALLAGCANVQGGACGERFEWPWGKPVGAPIETGELSSMSPVAIPRGLGAPSSISRAEGGLVTFAYETSMGQFWITQKRTDRRQLPGIVPLCGGREELTLARGITAVLIYGESTRYLTWFEGGLRFQVMGDSADITREEALRIASHVPVPR